MKGPFLLYGIVVVIIASLMSWGEVANRAGGAGIWRSSSGSGSWSSGGHK